MKLSNTYRPPFHVCGIEPLLTINNLIFNYHVISDYVHGQDASIMFHEEVAVSTTPLYNLKFCAEGMITF